MRLPGTQLGARKLAPFSQPVVKPTIPPPEANPWWWHPGRPGVPVGAPSYLARKIADVDPDIELTQNRYTGRWQVWMKAPAFKHKVCWGWKLLFSVDYPNEQNVIARLYQASARKWGNAREYFAAIEREMERDRERREKASTQDAVDQAMEVFDYSQIKNIGPGNKFSTYQA